MLNNPKEYTAMAEAEQGLWWYRVLHEQSILALPLRRGSTNRGTVGEGALSELSILDAGCGTGGLMLKLKAAGYTNVVGADISEHAQQICQSRKLNVIQASITELHQKLVGQQFDVIVCNDVLCYFTPEEVPPTIEGFKSLLKPGGLLIMNNPAHAAFSGEHDRAVGIVTRFKPKELLLAISYHLSVIGCTQWPFLLSPAIYVARKLQRMQGRAEAQSDVKMPLRMINTLLYGICKLEMKLFAKAPFGSSVFIVARNEDKN
jgi:2-polyprenyl-3-methyl-5-hydroxy-6-metoxy-1,4-benzoquinol methylase